MHNNYYLASYCILAVQLLEKKENSHKGAKTQRTTEHATENIIVNALASWRLGAKMEYS